MIRIQFFESKQAAVESVENGLTRWENNQNKLAGKRFIFPIKTEPIFDNDSCVVLVRHKSTGSKTLVFVYAVDREKTLWCSWIITKNQIDGLKKFLELYLEIDKNNLSETVLRNEKLSDFAIGDYA